MSIVLVIAMLTMPLQNLHYISAYGVTLWKIFHLEISLCISNKVCDNHCFAEVHNSKIISAAVSYNKSDSQCQGTQEIVNIRFRIFKLYVLLQLYELCKIY